MGTDVAIAMISRLGQRADITHAPAKLEDVRYKALKPMSNLIDTNQKPKSSATCFTLTTATPYCDGTSSREERLNFMLHSYHSLQILAHEDAAIAPCTHARGVPTQELKHREASPCPLHSHFLASQF